MFSFVLFAALAVAASATPYKTPSVFPDGRIIGGENAVIETYPYQVSLQSYGRHMCGASIISAYYIVTAGHCAGGHVSSYTIRSGTTYRDDGGSIHEVESITRHYQYSSNIYGVPSNDIAVMKVKTPFVFDDTTQPIELFKSGEPTYDGEITVVTGWGSTGGWGLPSQLQTVFIPIINKELCNEAYKGYGGLPAGQICAAYYGQGGKDACQGDSGGPLTIGGRLAGVVSWGNGCAQAYYPGAYTEVASYRDWINLHAEL